MNASYSPAWQHYVETAEIHWWKPWFRIKIRCNLTVWFGFHWTPELPSGNDAGMRAVDCRILLRSWCVSVMPGPCRHQASMIKRLLLWFGGACNRGEIALTKVNDKSGVSVCYIWSVYCCTFCGRFDGNATRYYQAIDWRFLHPWMSVQTFLSVIVLCCSVQNASDWLCDV